MTLAAVGLVAGWGAAFCLPRVVASQGNLSTQGVGYPEGELSTGALASGVGFAEFDPLSPINPASLPTLGQPILHLQYEPEFRTVTIGGVTQRSTTARFPNLAVAVPLNPRMIVALSAASLLDRTWQTDVTAPTAVGDTIVPSTTTFRSSGGIEDIRLGLGWRSAHWLQLGVAIHGYTGENRIFVQRTFGDTAIVKTLTFTQNTTYSYGGNAASVGIILFPAGPLSLATSYRVGGTLRLRRNDTLQTRGSIPPRAGADLRYSGLAGVSFGVRADWEGWSRMSGLGFTNLHARDALEIGGGVDLTGPRFGPGDQSIILHVGARERDLPFRAAGAVVHETGLSGGLGLPIAGRRGVLDIGVQHAARSAPIGVSESAWTFSVGVTVRP